MSITVKDCLTLPSLRLGKVIAGKKGLDGIVSSVTVLEFDLTAEDLFVPNELAITAFYDIRNSVSDQIKTIKAAKQSGIVALVLFYSTTILNGVDLRVIQAAEQCNLPLILLPGEDMKLKYSDVIHDISEAIFLDARSDDFYINSTMARISQMNPQHRNINNILSLISEYNRCSVILCEKNKNILGCAFWPTNHTFDIKELIADKLQSEKIYFYEFKLKNDAELRIYFANPFLPVSRKILSETAEIIQLYTSIWNVNLNTKSKESIVSFIMEDKQNILHEIANANNIVLQSYTSMLIFHQNENIEKIKNKLKEYDNLYIADTYEKVFIAFITVNLSNTKGLLLTDELSMLCREKLYILTEKNITEKAKKYYIQFCKTEDAIRKIYPNKRIIRSDILYFAENCTELFKENNAISSYYKALLSPIYSEKENELLQTLQTYMFDADTSTKLTADILFIHRNTVKYRLDHVKELIGYDFEQMPLYYNVYIAAALKRLEAN